MNYANSEKFYTCMATPDLSVIQRFIVPDIVQKFQRPFANPELGYGKITRILIRTQLCVPIQIKVLVREKKKLTPSPPPPPDVLYLMFKGKKRQKKKDKKKSKKEKKAETNKQTNKKNASDFSTRQRSTLASHAMSRFPILYIYMCSGRQSLPTRGSLSACSSVSN